MLKGEPGWYNSTYFDEIYHARTGYEHYLAMKGDYTYYPYETSHPPLGKVLMAFSIGLFGMTPFGWRFAGAFAGILMLPGMYLLGKMLTKRRSGAVLSICLMALDFMHYTQTRIATIDSFVVLFIIRLTVFPEIKDTVHQSISRQYVFMGPVRYTGRRLSESLYEKHVSDRPAV